MSVSQQERTNEGVVDADTGRDLGADDDGLPKKNEKGFKSFCEARLVYFLLKGKGQQSLCVSSLIVCSSNVCVCLAGSLFLFFPEELEPSVSLMFQILTMRQSNEHIVQGNVLRDYEKKDNAVGN